jgi:membrane protein YdbS with pleckstrin-like domain
MGCNKIETKKEDATMARKERLTEDAKYTTELLRLAWATLIAVGAGTVCLTVKEFDWRIAAGAGAVVIVGMGFVVWRLHRKVRVTITSLEEV